MSVNTSEEYLDELLQAIEPIIYMNEPVPEPEPEMEKTAEEPDTKSNLLDNLMEIPAQEPASPAKEEILTSEEENSLTELLSAEFPLEEEVSMNDLLSSLAAESAAEEVTEMGMEEAADIDAMLKAAADTADSMSNASVSHEEDVRALLQQFTDDEDLSDIGNILERDDNNEAVDESILETPEVEVFRLEEENAEAAEEKKESKGIFGFFKKKKGRKKKEREAEAENPGAEEAETENSETGAAADAAISEEAAQENMEELLSEDTFADLAGLDLFGLEANNEPLSENKEEAEDLSSMSLDDIFAEGDMTDIDQLLSAGSFAEEGLPIEEASGELAFIEEKDEGKKKSEKKKPEKKESFFTKILTMLTEEEEEEEPKTDAVPEAGATGVTNENIAILSELSKEEKKKRKKEKKEQKKKEKEDKKKGKPSSEGEEEEGGEDAKKNEKEKKKRIRKEKPRKVVDIDEKPPKKLSRKKVTVIFALCFSILAMILILQTVLLNLSEAREAKKAFDNADYETCYANLYGRERSEEEEEIYQKSYIILSVQRKWDSYQNLRQMGMDVEALNALLEGARVYRDLDERAESLRISDRVTDRYRKIYDELKNYGLSDADIEEILAYESKVSYTKRLESIVYGTSFEVDSVEPEADQEEIEKEPKPLEDVLPQEEDFLPEDTGLIYEMNSEEADFQDQMPEEPEQPQIQEKQPLVEQGNTVVVGSAPVDISGSSNEGTSTGGVNVGNGDTNISATVNGDGAVISGL